MSYLTAKKNYAVWVEGRLNKKLFKGKIGEALGPTRESLTKQNEQEIRELDQKIAEDEQDANDDSLSDNIRERVRERAQEHRARQAELENEQEELEQKLSLRERLKRIFKKYGFTLTAFALAGGATIGAVVSVLTKRLASVANGVGNALKDLGKKIASILPGLIGSIVSFVFRTVKFLGENAWLLILAVATFLIEQRKRKSS